MVFHFSSPSLEWMVRTIDFSLGAKAYFVNFSTSSRVLVLI